MHKGKTEIAENKKGNKKGNKRGDEGENKKENERGNKNRSENLKSLINECNFEPKKYWGQNFLMDKEVLADIVKTADLKKSDVVLEIGPGFGVLTKELAKKTSKVIAVEKDERLIKMLKRGLKGFKNVEIIHGDILKINIKNVIASEGAKRPSAAISDDNYNNTTGLLCPISGRARNDRMYYKIVANLPYYITSPVIRKFLEEKNPPKLMVLMVQKEVAERICAKPPKMSLLSVACQFYATPEIVRIVKKECFWPKPKVDSAIIKLKINNLQLATEFREQFFKIVKAGFSSPRKQLKNNLKRKLKLDEKTVEDWLLKNNIQPIQRSETLLVEDWINLTNSFPLSTPLQAPQ